MLTLLKHFSKGKSVLRFPSFANPKLKLLIHLFINNLKLLKMLQAKFLKSRPNGKAIYTLSGSPAELDAYIKHQGSYARFADDKVTPLIFADTPMNISKMHQVHFSPELNRYYVDFSEITTASGQVATAEKRGGDRIANEFAKQVVMELRGNSISTTTSSAIDAAMAAPAAEASGEEDLEELAQQVSKPASRK